MRQKALRRSLRLGVPSLSSRQPGLGLGLFLILVLTAAGGCVRESPCLRQVSNNGFGDSWNRYPWAMTEFGDFLYVGTFNVDLWGEPTATGGWVDSISQGTEVWRYGGGDWEQVVDRGFKDSSDNLGIRNLRVYDGMLYAGTVNYTQGCEVWRSPDGTAWEPIMQGGFGSPSSGSVRGMAEYQGLLYVGVENFVEGGQIHAWDGSSWTTVVVGGLGNPINISVSDMVVWKNLLFVFTWNFLGFEVYTYDGVAFECLGGVGGPNPPGLGQWTNTGAMGVSLYKDRLYLGTADFLFGADLFRTDDGRNWVQLVDNGFGDQRQAYIWWITEYRGDLYLGTFHEGHFPLFFREGGRLYRMNPAEEFEELVGPNGTLMDEGFGDGMNYGIRTMSVFQDKLYLGATQCFFCPFREGLEIWELDPDAQGCTLKTSECRSAL